MNEAQSSKSGVGWRVVFATFVAVMAGAALVYAMLPHEYFTKGVVEWKGPIVFPDEDNAVVTKAEIILSKEVLYPVIEKLNLGERWGGNTKDVTYLRMLKRIEVKEVRNSDLVEIGVYDSNAQSAAEIANAIASTWLERRKLICKDYLSEDSRMFSFAKKKAADAAALVAKIRSEQVIADNSPDSSHLTKNPFSDEYHRAEGECIEARRRLDWAESHSARVREVASSPTSIVAKAGPSKIPARPNISLFASLAALLGLGVGIGIARFVERRRV